MRMGQSSHYKLDDLVEKSGFDKRTIAYYVQESLLPRVGRRGPRTRYSQDFLDRLMFIRRVRDLQDGGQLRAVTLSEIREVIERQTPDEVSALAQESVDAEAIRSLFEEPDLDAQHLAIPAEAVAAIERPPTRSSADPEESFLSLRSSLDGPAMLRRAPGPASRLRELLREIDLRARKGEARTRLRTGERVTRVTRVPVSDAIDLSVRNLDDRDARLVETLAKELRDLGDLDLDE